MTLLAVLGSPIAHSRSPLIHRAAYAALGLDWRYTRVRCGEAGLERFLMGRGPEWRGLSLTMPLKEEAFRLAAVADPVAQESGVVNTLVRQSDGGWAGYNTDVAGLATAMEQAGLDASRTIVLGSGATAVSAILAARSLGAEHIDVVARNSAAVGNLVRRFNGASDPVTGRAPRVTGTGFDGFERLVREGAPTGPHTLVVSALPGPAAAHTEVPAAALRIPLFDVAYDPWPSPFAARWRAAGGEASPGIAMLVEQALVQIRIFVAGEPAIPLAGEAAVRAAVAAATARAT